MTRTKAALLAVALLPATAGAATLGGYDYATQYSFSEFFTATDGKPFRVVVDGNPFPSLPIEDVARRMLPVMQAAKPPPNLTFTYDVPVERPRPDYRMVLVFDPANDLGADPVCQGVSRHRPGTPGKVYVFAVYCRNDQAMSQVTGWTSAGAPDDGNMNDLYRQLFSVLFDRSPGIMPRSDAPFRG
jgi:hypothetical protein